MSTILMAMAVGAFSMIVVFISGLISGVVRIGTLSLRSFIAFCITSTIVYFLLMIFEMYCGKNSKVGEQVAKDTAEGEEKSADENSSTENSAENFQPMNPNNFPRM